MNVTELSDEQLAASAAREGSDGPAFVALVERFRQRVWQICFRLMSNEDDANDAAQEVFVRLFLNRAKFEGRSKYSTWVHGIAVRTCLTMRRGRGRRRKNMKTSLPIRSIEQQAPDRSPSDAGLSLDLMAMLNILDEEDRAMLILKYAENYSYDELPKSSATRSAPARCAVSRACDKIQERFGAA